MWNCWAVSCSIGASGPVLRHGLRRQFSHTIRTFPLIWFPRHKNNFIEKVGPYASGSLQSPDVFEPIPVVTARWAVQLLVFPAGVFLFRFLYFYPLEDELDLDEEAEGERRR